MRRVSVVVLLGLLFFAPLAYFGELEAWSFKEPVSNLEWDEAGIRPQQSGGDNSGSNSGDSSSSDSGGSGGGASVEGEGPGGSGGGASVEGEGSGGGGSSNERSGSGGGGQSGPSGGSSGGNFGGFTFAFGSFFLCFGAMWAFWAPAMSAFFTAMANFFVWWMWMLVLLAMLPFWWLMSALGIIGGLLGVGGLVTLVVMHQKGMLFSASAGVE